MFKITFVGICLFLGVANGPRTVILPDLLNGDDVHGNHIQAHEATIRVREESVVMASTNWPYTKFKDKNKDVVYLVFPLDHQQLTLIGIDAKPPLVVTDDYACLVPRLAEQCPAHDAIRPDEELKAEAVAWMTLAGGTLSAERAQKGAVSSNYSGPASGNVTIVGTANGKTLTITTEPNAEVAIVNAPTEDEMVPNHFLAYYRLLMPSSCCTNIPFPYKRRGCSDPQKVGRDEIAGVRVSTVACSNSNYP